MTYYKYFKDLAHLYPETDYNLIVYSGAFNETWKYCGVFNSISSLSKLRKDVRNYIIYEPILDFLIICDGNITYYQTTPEWFNAELLLRLPTPKEFVETIDTDCILDYDDPQLIKLLES